jgi:hypothetical protein
MADTATAHPPLRPLTREALQNLVAPRPGPLVSVYLPVYRAFPDASKNAVVHQHAVEALTQRLNDHGVATDRVAAWSQRLGAVDADFRALAHPNGTLAVFLDASGIHVHPLVVEAPYCVAVAESYRVRPLLRELQHNRRYRVLALSARRVALLEGDAGGLHTVATPDLPASLEEALGAQLVGRQFEVRGGARAGGATYHGSGGRKEAREVDLERFHRVVAQGLGAYLQGSPRPLILAADTPHQSGLRSVAKLSGLLSQNLPGNPDHLSEAELHARTWPIIESVTTAQQRELVGNYERARNHGKGVDLLDDVAAAAVSGRIRRLWVDLERRIPGHVDPGNGRISDAKGDEDVLDGLTTLVLRHGGDVTVLEPDAMPVTTGVAGELR